MARLGEIAAKIRSKNAGPFVLTIDIFCGDSARFAAICAALSTARIAALYQQPEAEVRRFELPALNVVKFSMPRPTVQGSVHDRDMHAAQWAWILADLELDI